MRNILSITAAVLTVSFLGCSSSDFQTSVQSADSDNNQSVAGSLKLNLSNGDEDAVALAKKIQGKENDSDNVEHVWITIKDVQLHVAGDSSDNGWKTVASPNATFDFLKLVNGLTIPLDLYPLPAGHYTQIRLILAGDDEKSGTIPSNSIVVNGETFPITIPSSDRTGIKCVHSFKIAEGEVTEICLKFDVLKAIHFAPGTGYKMKPTFKTYKCEGIAYYGYSF